MPVEEHSSPRLFVHSYSRFDCTHLFYGVGPDLFWNLPCHALSLTWLCRPGITLTETWTTSNALDTKLELENNVVQGLKAEITSSFLPNNKNYGGKVNLFYKQPNVNLRAFVDPFKGPTAIFDAVLGHEGYLAGGEVGYDVQKAAITRYSAALGYSSPLYAAAITASNNLSIFSASYYHKVNAEVEAGAKATWDSKAGSTVGLEIATKYKLDPSSFVKVCQAPILPYKTELH